MEFFKKAHWRFDLLYFWLCLFLTDRSWWSSLRGCEAQSDKKILWGICAQNMCSWNQLLKAIGGHCNSQRVCRWLRRTLSSLSSKFARKFPKWLGRRDAKCCWRQAWFLWWARLRQLFLVYLIGCFVQAFKCFGAFSRNPLRVLCACRNACCCSCGHFSFKSYTN